MECLESKDKGIVNRVNVKQVMGDLGNTSEGAEVVVKSNSRRYLAKVVDLLDGQQNKRSSWYVKNGKQRRGR